MFPDLRQIHRRSFIGNTSRGLGAVALASLLGRTGLEAAPGVFSKLPLPQKAKRVIWLTMAGGPSQLELFDHKPKLAEMDGKGMPESFTAGQQLAQLQGQKLICQGPQFKFSKHGKNGTELSELLPHIGSVADDICVIRSMTTDAINHDPAHMFMNTGSQIAGRPSMGSWVTYGLGSEAEDLPGFVVLVSTGKGRSPQPIAARQWSSGFLPSKHQGVQLRSKGDPVLYLNNPPGISRASQQGDVEAINSLNQVRAGEVSDTEVATRIAQYEMAFRMQASVPGLMDVSGLKKVHLVGPHAIAVLDYITTRDINKVYPGKSVYACMLDDRGMFTDDCIVYRTGPNSFMRVHGSGSAHEQIVKAAMGRNVAVLFDDDLHDLSLQGPLAVDFLAQHVPGIREIGRAHV